MRGCFVGRGAGWVDDVVSVTRIERSCRKVLDGGTVFGSSYFHVSP